MRMGWPNFGAKFENSDGLCISVVGGNLVKFDENKLSEWFNVHAVGYKEYVKGKAKLNVEGENNGIILKFFVGHPYDLSMD